MPAPARRAATVALLRDGDAGLEVFVMKRAASMAAAPDMHVFPGGGVDAADGAPGDPGSTQAAARRELFEETGVVLPEEAPLAYFARWITPEPLPHRHDTDFFAAPLPSGQEPGLVGTEAQDCGWTAPAAAIDDALAGRIGLLPPTAAAMYQLAAFPDVAGALDGLSREAGDPPPALMPVRGPDGWVLRDTSSGRDITDPVELGLPPRWRPIPPGLP
ncbi:MAG: NUDIX hydrolase [Actinobacteria bacterium]|nr:MAG: NUDIX hydrolase [Actinomycetota bacterium]